MLQKLKNVFLKKRTTEIARREKQLDSFLTKAYGPIGFEKRDEYEKLTSGRLFRAKYFKVVAHADKFSLEL